MKVRGLEEFGLFNPGETRLEICSVLEYLEVVRIWGMHSSRATAQAVTSEIPSEYKKNAMECN